MKILMMDTDVLTCEFLAGFLKIEGHEVLTMVPNAQSLDKINVVNPEVIFLGGSIPKKESLDMVRQIHARHPELPVFIVGGEGNKGYEDEFALAGSRGFISRGGSFESLISRVKSTMDLIKSRNLGKVKVMIVDDEPDIRDIIGMHLTESGFDVIEAENGKVGIEKAKAERPKIILMDFMMPEANGLEALAEIMKLKYDVAVIMATAISEEWVWKKSRELGAFDYLVKPINLKHLDLLISTKLLLM